MKRYPILLIIILLITIAWEGCENNHTTKENNCAFDFYIDSLPSTNNKKFVSVKNEIFNYDTAGIDYNEHHLLFDSIRIAFIDTIQNSSRRNGIYYNGDFLIECPAKTLIDSRKMDMIIDYNEMTLCYADSTRNIICLKTKPMNWVGRMTRYTLYYFINIDQRTFAETIQED